MARPQPAFGATLSLGSSPARRGAVSLRKAVLGDSPTLAALETQSDHSAWGLERYRQVFATTSVERAWVAEQGSNVLGFVVVSVILDEAEIRNVFVHPGERRRGIARRLLIHALGAVREQGCTQCYLEVRQSNRAAQGLYAQLGFCLHGVRKNYYRVGDGRESADLMQLIFDEMQWQSNEHT